LFLEEFGLASDDYMTAIHKARLTFVLSRAHSPAKVEKSFTSGTLVPRQPMTNLATILGLSAANAAAVALVIAIAAAATG
jgi:hypothetical protein